MSQKGSPGPEWKHVWKNAKTGDDVYLHEDDGTVFLDMAERGHDHPDALYCQLCLPRLSAAGDAARRCLDPKADPFIEQITGKDDGPEFLALVTGRRLADEGERKAFAMRNDGGVKITSTKPILTTKKDNKPFDYPIVLADYTTESQVCDANYIKAFSVRLKDGTPEHYARRLWETKLTFAIDDEPLVKQAPFKEILQRREIVLPESIPDKCPIFSAIAVLDPMGEAKAVEDEWLGYILPSKSRILITLEDVPGGGGLVFIETSWKLVRYTTKSTPSKQ